MPEFGSSFDDVLSIPKRLSKEEAIRAMRFFVAAEYEAVQLYMKIAEASDDPIIKEALTEIADEERVHAGEFLRLLYYLDPKEKGFYNEGMKEIDDIMKKHKTKGYKVILKDEE